jgi:hypothetical protein
MINPVPNAEMRDTIKITKLNLWISEVEEGAERAPLRIIASNPTAACGVGWQQIWIKNNYILEVYYHGVIRIERPFAGRSPYLCGLMNGIITEFQSIGTTDEILHTPVYLAAALRQKANRSTSGGLKGAYLCGGKKKASWSGGARQVVKWGNSCMAQESA